MHRFVWEVFMRGFFVIDSKKSMISILIVSILTIIATMGSSLIEDVIETSASKRLLPVYSVEVSEPKVALTFDCAWEANDIPSIIDTLNNNNIKATFFTVGTWIDKNEEAVKLLSDNSMEIGSHSNLHTHVNKMSYGEVLEDMVKCNDKIKNITGSDVRYYRGPYGEYNNTVINVAKQLNMQVIQWDVDTLDYEGKTGDEMCERIKKKIQNGSIILMHNSTKHTASSLQQIIDFVNDLGYSIVPLDELIYEDDFEINHEGRQIKSIN